VSDEAPSAVPTSLGPSCVQRGAGWILDLTELPLFHGLSVLARALGEMVIEQARHDRIDIAVERAIRPRENPELLDRLKVERVKLEGDHAFVAGLVRDADAFQDRLRALFGTLQRPRYRGALFGDQRSTALLFRFAFPGDPSTDAVFLLERLVPAQRSEVCFLRITIEDPARPRLDLARLPHAEVEDLDDRSFIAGSTRIAQTWAEGLQREAERGRRDFTEAKRPHSHLFRQLEKAGLGEIESVTLHWTEALIDRLLDSDPDETSHALKRVLLALEDRFVRDLLRDRRTVRIECGNVVVCVDQSQLGRVLSLSLGGPRERLGLNAYLDRMPAVSRMIEDQTASRPLTGVKVVLVHHITSEVLGLIAAIRRLGCTDLTTIFVAYAGEAPASYLDPLLELPPEEFRCMALVNVPDAESVEGHYKLSHRFSVLDDHDAIEAMLDRQRMRFFDAMKALSVSAFVQTIARARAEGEPCLLVEDGGYLAPIVNDACLRGESVGAFLAGANAVGDHAAGEPLRDMLDGVLLGSIEHTRNGFDRVASVEAEHGALAFPAFSVAISRHKVEVESREVATSILNAIENALNATGHIQARRRCVVLGHRGAIGTHLIDQLTARLDESSSQLSGIDLKVDEATNGAHPEAACFGDLRQDVRDGIDLVIGVTGVSVLQGDELAAWLLRGERRRLVLASGSTKTAEFVDLAEWLDGLLGSDAPTIGGHPVEIATGGVIDPITGRLYGHRFDFAIDVGGDVREREVVFLANMMPVNFMFYGVPTEVIDEVLAELLSASLGLLRRVRAAGADVPRRLLAVDRDIDMRGEPL
jgi:hypothetical protein